MSLFGEISGLLGDGQTGMSDDAKSGLGSALDGILKEQGINGIPGMLQKFEQSGLGAQAASWVSNNESNLPVSAQHIVQALGPDVVGAIAGRLGIPSDQASQLLSQHLPGVVDHMTPQGSAPDQSDDDDQSEDDADDEGDAKPR